MINRWLKKISHQFSSLEMSSHNNRNSADTESQITIDFGAGNLTDGFSDVRIQLFRADSPQPDQQTIRLPRNPDLELLLNKWRALYLSIYGVYDLRGDIELDLSIPTNVSDVDLEELGEELKQSLNNWLVPIERKLLYSLQKIEGLRTIITTKDEQLQRLPWHLWELFDSKKRAEYALSAPNYQKPKPSRTPKGIVRILAVFGNAEGIDLKSDRETLSSLSNADVCILDKPDLITLDRTLRDSQGWDLLFFAGHSNTIDGSGVLKINDRDILTTKQLRSSIATATENGTQLAIFNSCDGIGLASALGGIGLSHIIVMGESIPDPVAKKFITFWLTEFASGKSFYATTRETREQLKILEQEYPCASWLPVIFQNPTAPAPTWRKLRSANQTSWKAPVAVGMAIASLVTGIRATGILQYPELKTYDTFLSWRNDEGTDPRILLVVGRDETRFDYPFEDKYIAETIETIAKFEPRSIGLDLTRNIKQKDDNNRLKQVFLNNQRVTNVCLQEEKKSNQPTNFGPNRMGYANSLVDGIDNTSRRIPLFSVPDSRDSCRADYYLGTKLALDYLAQDSIVPQNTPDGEVKIGVQKYRSLPKYMGAYQEKDRWVYETLINFRMGNTPFKMVSIADIRDGEVNPDLIKDRIVIIGMDLKDLEDRHNLPFEYDVPGVKVVAHVTSQILDNALGNKPAIWVVVNFVEICWIVVSSITGALVATYGGDRKALWIAIGTGLLIIPGVGWFVLQTYGLWIPVFPLGLSFLGSYFATRFYINRSSNSRFLQ